MAKECSIGTHFHLIWSKVIGLLKDRIRKAPGNDKVKVFFPNSDLKSINFYLSSLGALLYSHILVYSSNT